MGRWNFATRGGTVAPSRMTTVRERGRSSDSPEATMSEKASRGSFWARVCSVEPLPSTKKTMEGRTTFDTLTVKKMKMDSYQAKHARRLFEKEVKNLIRIGVPAMDASSLDEYTTGASIAKTRVRHPVLGAGEESDKDHCERIFEDEFDGEIPKSLVGFEFHDEEALDALLQRLATKLISEGVETARDLRNLEMMEAKAVKKTLSQTHQAIGGMASDDGNGIE
mmetsp:Transcript_16796/g.34995  ORF Transcript_16796/g.34995 Transcript_16796/m.34995 type:complete len:223 (+) Transcript_16796:2772-3440(+)